MVRIPLIVRIIGTMISPTVEFERGSDAAEADPQILITMGDKQRTVKLSELEEVVRRLKG
jgi:hypothetical protein